MENYFLESFFISMGVLSAVGVTILVLSAVGAVILFFKKK